MRTIVTGAAGFIGAAATTALLGQGDIVLGIDDHNHYYDPSLKSARVGINVLHPSYTHLQFDVTDPLPLKRAFCDFKPDRVLHLAAQPGVRYSVTHPESCIKNNIVGFANILEECRHSEVQHLVYASTSSVYGANTSLPFATTNSADHPLSLYASSKRSNELMAHAYSHLFGIPTTGLRFFTVYGPWGRPDMALFNFTECALKGLPIKIYNGGYHTRDFTYIDDIVSGVVRVLERPAKGVINWNSDAPSFNSSSAPWRIYNIGNGRPCSLIDFVDAIEMHLGLSILKEYLPLQLGDMVDTAADIKDLEQDFNFSPKVDVVQGVGKFINWYRDYFRV
jgi:UDP-glucuronate 4-epimerase